MNLVGVYFINKFRGLFVYWSWEYVEEEQVFPTHIGSSRWLVMYIIEMLIECVYKFVCAIHGW